MIRNAGVLVDTSAWIDFFRADGDPEVHAQVKSCVLHRRARLADMVLLELWNGARSTRDRHLLERLQEEIERVSTSPQVWAEAWGLARKLRAGGITAPATDILIAACARHHRLELLHRDAHLDRIADLRDGSR